MEMRTPIGGPATTLEEIVEQLRLAVSDGRMSPLKGAAPGKSVKPYDPKEILLEKERLQAAHRFG